MKMLEKIQIEDIINIAKEAGEAIMEVYKKDFEVFEKADQSPLTIADKKANDIIVKRLRALQLENIHLISEEEKEVPYAVRKNWEYFWLVDPLDGTKEFIKKNDEFTVNIALIKNHRPILGVIYVPATQEVYYAIKEKGSYKIDQFGNKKQLKVKMANKNLKIVASRSHLSTEVETYIADQKKKYTYVSCIAAGSSLKFCLVAEGIADVYPRLGPTMEWDTGAGQIIVEEAGGEVIRVDNNNVLDYNKKNLLNPFFIVKRLEAI